MATSGLAEKQFTSGLGELLAGLGTKTKTTQVATANTGPLETVIANASKPMDMALYNALIANIMQTAAQQVPELSSALANATGSRTSNNSPLALAIAKLQADAANAGASKVLDFNQNQSQIAANAAGNLAHSTRTVNDTQTVKQAVTPLATMLLGTLVNQVDKRGGFDRIFGRGNVADFATGGASAYTVPTYEAMAPQIQQFQTDFAQYDTTPMVGPTQEAFGPQPLDIFGAGVNNFTSDAGFANFLTGSLDGVTADTAAADTLSGIPGDGFSSGFDISGADLPWSPDEFWFADGGVVRNRNNMGGPIQRQGMGAIAVPESAAAQTAGGPGNTGITSNQLLSLLMRSAQAAEQIPNTGDSVAAEGRSTPGGAINMAQGNTLGANVARGLAGLGTSLALGPVFGQLGPAGSFIAREGVKSMGVPMNGVLGLLTAIATSAAAESRATESINKAVDPLGALVLAIEAGAPGKVGNLEGIQGNMNTAAAAANAINAVNPAVDPISALIAVTNNFAGTPSGPSAADFGPTQSDMNPGAPAELSSFETNTSTTSDAMSDYGDAGGLDAMGGYGTDFADGGKVVGPGNGTSDSIKVPNKTPGGKNIRVSNGEFIFPADSVNAIGEDLLMRLLQATHTPVRR